jgi:hypothetical protein
MRQLHWSLWDIHTPYTQRNSPVAIKLAALIHPTWEHNVWDDLKWGKLITLSVLTTHQAWSCGAFLANILFESHTITSRMQSKFSCSDQLHKFWYKSITAVRSYFGGNCHLGAFNATVIETWLLYNFVKLPNTSSIHILLP